MYKYTHPQNKSITGTVSEEMYLKMKDDRSFKGYRWEKIEDAIIEPQPEIRPPAVIAQGNDGRVRFLPTDETDGTEDVDTVFGKIRMRREKAKKED